MTLVRDARPEDREAIARVLVAAFEQYRAGREAVIERYLEEVASAASLRAGTLVFVAERDGVILGTGTLCSPSEPADYATAMGGKAWPLGWGVLRYLAVDPAARGLGIGRLLALARIERARSLGAPMAALHTTSLFRASWSMYRAMGWTRAPEYDFAPAPDTLAEAYVLPLT